MSITHFDLLFTLIYDKGLSVYYVNIDQANYNSVPGCGIGIIISKLQRIILVISEKRQFYLLISELYVGNFNE